MKDPIEEKITKARISMLLQAPFFGNLATRLILVDATHEPWCKTAGTDGRHFYYNRDFFAKLDKQETIWVVGHEVLHCVYDHMSRRGGRDKNLWNAAADFVINWELHEQKIGKQVDKKTSGVQVLFDPKYKGMFSEEVYAELEKNAKHVKFEEFDAHLEPGDGKGKDLTEEERANIRDEIRQAVMEAAKVAGAGNTPLGIRRMIKDLTEPEMDWREILNMQIQSAFKSDYTWMRQSRKSQSCGYYLPGQLPDIKLEAAVAIDCSGSMSGDMLQDLLSEFKGIMDQFPDFKLRLWCFDTRVYGYAEFTPDNIEDINSYEIKGGGGTDFVCNWDYMKENDIVPHRFIMMTDGYPGGSWGDPDYCDTVFLVHSNPAKNLVGPFGMTVFYEPDSRSPQNRR
jgi:predicted metal-dependent peptidase